MSDFPPNLAIRPLTIEDADKCFELESKGFSEDERCSLEKFKYRLTVCPELCSGLFVREYDYKYNAINLPDVAEAKSKEQEESGKIDEEKGDEDDDEDEPEELPLKSSVVQETLVGHIIGTKTFSGKITTASMELASEANPEAGHVEHSRTIGIHSVVIDPKWQHKNLGTLLLHDYIQKLSNQDLGDKIVIIAHKELVPFYEKIGFVNLGESDCKFANTTWYDLSIDLVPDDDD